MDAQPSPSGQTPHHTGPELRNVTPPQPAPGGLARSVRRMIFGLAPDEASFAKRGFRGAGEPAQARVEQIGATFVHAYNAVLDAPEPESLLPVLDALEPDLRGFAYEGAAMSLALLETLAPWGGPRVKRFLEAGAHRYTHLVHVGVGWAWARLRTGIPRGLAKLDPMLGWLAVDGLGFHEGFFHAARYVEARQPPRLKGYAARAFDQGLGRSLWFVEGAGVERIIARLASFPEARLPDMWAGVGLACAYAGGVERSALVRLREASGPYLPQLRQGVVFATGARTHSGNLAPQTELACDVIWERPAPFVSAVSDRALQELGPETDDEPRFESWRRAIHRLAAL